MKTATNTTRATIRVRSNLQAGWDGGVGDPMRKAGGDPGADKFSWGGGTNHP
jgi:hypothetical protein